MPARAPEFSPEPLPPVRPRYTRCSSETVSELGRPPSWARSERSSRKRSIFSIARTIVYLISFAAVVAAFLPGRAFYATAVSARAHQAGYWAYKPSGTIGHPLGIVGSAMLVLLLAYSLRKRTRVFGRVGSVSAWLDVHIYLGVFGPLLIVLHSSFKFGGLVALSFWSMVAVALSGVLGRYLYLQIPRTRAGDELTLAEIGEVDRGLSERLRADFSVPESVLRRLDDLASARARGGLIGILIGVLVADILLGHRLREVTRDCSVPPLLRQELLRLARQKAVIRRRIVLWDALHRLFHQWHIVHKPFAVVMYIFMVVHIWVATMTGYGRLW